MISKITKQILNFKSDIENAENTKTTDDIGLFLTVISEKIKEITKEYFDTKDYHEQELLKKDLIRYYNLLYYYQAKINGLERAYILSDGLEKLPDIYMVEQLPERFEINGELLKQINISEGLTIEQALELLKWTVNNTRDNLIAEGESSKGIPEDVYGNSSLVGACGFSQFSTLYPLKQLGLEVTINNVGQVCGERHAYGTVVIPIRSDGKIINKRFLLDCTYRQFFTLPFNVAARYLSHSPSVGFFVSQDEEQIKFAKELLKNGFVYASSENIEKYLKPFFYACTSVDNIYDIDKKFDDANVSEVIENKQEEFDYEENEFIEWGFNLEIGTSKSKTI